MSSTTATPPARIKPMSFERAFAHIDDCLKRRNYIVSTAYAETDEGIAVTVRRMGHRQYVDYHYTVPGCQLNDPVTHQAIASHAVASGIGRVNESYAQNARALMRVTALYVGLDGLFHITGQPDEIEPPVKSAVAEPIKLVA